MSSAECMCANSVWPRVLTVRIAMRSWTWYHFLLLGTLFRNWVSTEKTFFSVLFPALTLRVVNEFSLKEVVLWHGTFGILCNTEWWSRSWVALIQSRRISLETWIVCWNSTMIVIPPHTRQSITSSTLLPKPWRQSTDHFMLLKTQILFALPKESMIVILLNETWWVKQNLTGKTHKDWRKVLE